MKIEFLVYSLTGNTQAICEMVSRVLVNEGHHEVRFHSIIKACGEHLKNPAIKLGDSPKKHTEKLCAILQTADVVGLASLAWFAHVAPGIGELFQEIASLSLIVGKPSFFLLTAGAAEGLGMTDMYDALSKAGSLPIGCCSLCSAPDSFVDFAPKKPFIYRWGEQEMNKCIPFAQNLNKILASGQFTPISKPKTNFIMRIAGKKFTSEGIRGQVQQVKIVINSDQCIMCKACISGCPGTALDLEDAISDSGNKMIRWKPELCFGCCRCVSKCPKNAITVLGKETNNFHLFKQGITTKPGHNNYSVITMALNKMFSGNAQKASNIIIISFAITTFSFLIHFFLF